MGKKTTEIKVPIISKDTEGDLMKVVCLFNNDLKVVHYFLSNNCTLISKNLSGVNRWVMIFQEKKKTE